MVRRQETGARDGKGLASLQNVLQSQEFQHVDKIVKIDKNGSQLQENIEVDEARLAQNSGARHKGTSDPQHGLLLRLVFGLRIHRLHAKQ